MSTSTWEVWASAVLTRTKKGFPQPGAVMDFDAADSCPEKVRVVDVDDVASLQRHKQQAIYAIEEIGHVPRWTVVNLRKYLTDRI
jgi:hypothetical protein